MKKYLIFFIASLIFSMGITASAMAEDCGVPEKQFDVIMNSLNKPQGVDRVHEMKLQLHNMAISTSQAIRLLEKLDRVHRNDAAVMLYAKVCDVKNWNKVYARKLKGMDRELVKNKVKGIERIDRKYNQTHHPEWYPELQNTQDQKTHNPEWKADLVLSDSNSQIVVHSGHSSNKYHDSQKQNRHLDSERAELERQKIELERQKNELERQKALFARQQAEIEKERAIEESYQAGFNAGYNNGIDDSTQYIGNTCTAMSNASFGALMDTLRNTPFKTDKESVVMTAASTNNFSVSQAVAIIKEMDFMDSEETAAVALYPAICDKENWFMISSAYSFPNSTRTVNELLGL